MKFYLRLLNILLFMALTSACSENNLPVYVKLEGLRVLALVSDKPEVNPGGSFTITPYVSDVLGSGRALTYTAEACLDPGVSYGATPTCLGSATRVVIATNQAVTGLGSPNYTGATNSIGPITTPSSAIAFAARTTVDQFNGVTYLVTYDVTSSDGKSVSAYKRILISNKTSLNANPTLSDLLANDASLSSLPAGQVALKASFPSASRETYSVMESSGSLTSQMESLVTTWFYTDGETKFFRTTNTDTTTYTPPGERPSGRNVLIIGVLRDERGGAAVTVKTL